MNDIFWQGWSIGSESGKQILNILQSFKPRVIVDLGSGYSTVMLGVWAKNNNAKVYSFEQSIKYYIETKNLLKRYEAMESVELIHRSLAQTPHGLFYDSGDVMPDHIDFAIIDGPAWTDNGRKATFYSLYPYLSKRYKVWVDDTYRELDTVARKEWEQAFPIKVTKQNDRSALLEPL